MEDKKQVECKKLLLVGDEQHSIFLILTYLDACGYEITSIHDGQVALKYLPKNRPDLILFCQDSDTSLDGYTFWQQIRQGTATRHLPFIQISSRNQPLEQVKNFDPATEAYIVRPFELDQLNRLIQIMASEQNTSSTHKIKPKNWAVAPPVGMPQSISPFFQNSFAYLSNPAT